MWNRFSSVAADPSPEAVLESLKKKAAHEGGDTLAVLPGLRSVAGTVRGSVFDCGGDPPGGG